MTPRLRTITLSLVCGSPWLSACGDDGTATTESTATEATTDTTTGGETTSPSTTTGTTEPQPTTTTPTTTDATPDPTAVTTSTSSDTTTSTSTTDPVDTESTTAAGCEPLADCGGACVDIQTDADHCGGCDAPCGVMEACVDAACVITCPRGQELCDGVCVDTGADPEHCGGCGQPCLDSEVCGDGACALECPMGQADCEGACVDTATDPSHCGGCGQACDACQICSDAQCEAPPDLPPAGAIEGPTDLCAGAEAMFTVPEVPGAVSYTWSGPVGATVIAGQDTAAATVKFGATAGQVCVSYSDGCATSTPSCIAIALTGGTPGQQVFTATGAIQPFVVPQCIKTLKITAFGAQGGSDAGGLGAKMSGTFNVTPGDQFGVVVGERGVANNCGVAPGTGGGGGGSFVWRIADATEPLIAAGGGGGGNTNWDDLNCRKGLDGVVGIHGTNGNGAPSAAGGTNGNGGAGNAPSGTGSGGAGWKSAGQDSTYGTGCTGGKPPLLFTGGAGSNTFGPGGQGGFGGGGGAVCGAGGGGGYSGGGAGEGSTCRAGGGGGGSFNAGTAQDNQPGARAGAGEVTISWP